MIMCYDEPCYGVEPGSDGNPEVIVTMDRKRYSAASLELKSGKLWISGKFVHIFKTSFSFLSMCLNPIIYSIFSFKIILLNAFFEPHCFNF